MKFSKYEGNGLGYCRVMLKIDGVRAVFTEEGVFSRKGKPLHNLNHLRDKYLGCEAEVFLGSWEESVSAVRTHNASPVEEDNIFILSKDGKYSPDERLYISTHSQLSEDEVYHILDDVVKKGQEGLIIESEGKLYKIKPVETYDVPILKIIEGKGKNKGKMGALVTPMGKVGTGFTDEQRKYFFDEGKLGTVIEVESMELTKNGKFRHPRFLRERFDK